MRITRWSPVWARRSLLAGMLVGAALVPGYAAGTAARHCPVHCGAAIGNVRWVQPLAGEWAAEGGVTGTVPAAGQAYVAAGPQVAVLGYGMNVYAYDVATGSPLWAATLTGFPDGASIVSVRSWPGVVTAGVAFPGASGQVTRDEVVLGAQSGLQGRSFAAAAYGGAVAADAAHTVVVGADAVTSYDNATGRAAWSRPTGAAAQAWRADGSYLYVTVAAGGYVGAAPVTGLRQISLVTGAERLIRPQRGPFEGTLSAAFDGTLVFSDAAGVTAYSEATGQWLWHRAGVVPRLEDLVTQTLYVTGRPGLAGLAGLDPQTGAWARRSSVPGSSGLYGIRDGVALGLDQGALGDAWGYDVSLRRVIWTTPALPWPHYFIDLSGIGGSADPSSGTVLLAACAGLGGSTAARSGHVCLRPELVAVSR